MKPLVPRSCLILVSFFVAGAAASGAEPGIQTVEVPPSILKRYDKNKNGVLELDEQLKWEADKLARREKDRAERAAILEKYDLDKDGKLSEEEKASAKIGWQKERSEKEAEKMKERAAKAKAERESAEKEKAAAAAEAPEKPAETGMMMSE